MTKIYMPPQSHNTWMMNSYLREMEHNCWHVSKIDARYEILGSPAATWKQATLRAAGRRAIDAQTNAIAFASR